VFGETYPEVTLRFLEQADSLCVQVLDALFDVYVFAKDCSGRFVYCNKAFMALMGFDRPHELIGRSDRELSPGYLVQHYRDDDSIVLAGEVITDRVELVRNRRGTYDWFATTKLPLRHRYEPDSVIGIVGITRPLLGRQEIACEVLPLQPAVGMMLEHYAERLTVDELAKSSGMSVRSFSQSFRNHFGLTPNLYLRHVRLMVATELLSTTELPVGVVACRVGYYDQSHFANDFRRFLKMTPREYRGRYNRVGIESIGWSFS